MNETENTRLLRLYKLLWEQIKDKKYFEIPTETTHSMASNAIISGYEKEIIDVHILENINLNEDSKAFVQRMIKERSDGSN